MSIIVVHSKDVQIEGMEEQDGWAISEFRLPITGKIGSATTAFLSIFQPGSTHAKHLHEASDEIAVYLSGKGVVGQGNSCADVSAGHCRLMPKGSVHFFYNETEDRDARVIGFYMNAPNVAGTGYKFCGAVTPEDLAKARDGLEEGILVRFEDADAVISGLPESWKQAEVRAPIGAHNGSPNSLLHITMRPGRFIEAFQLTNAEAIYYVESGEAKISDTVLGHDISHGSFAFVPLDIPHEIHNTGDVILEMFLVLTGAGSLEEAVKPNFY